MLTTGNMVLIRENGARKPVENINISDLVFDPWTQKYVEITDKLSRIVKFGTASHPESQALQPVEIKQGAISKGCPSSDLLVSPNQIILHLAKCSAIDKIPTLTESPARSLGIQLCETTTEKSLREIEYFALFTERPQTVDVQGVLLSTFCNDVYESAKKP